jgi:hypothetical protein
MEAYTIGMCTLALIAIAGLFLAWFFIRRERFKEKIILLEKGIDIKDLDLMGDKKFHFPWLRIGIICIGWAMGGLFIELTHLNYAGRGGGSIVQLFIGVSIILAYFIGRSKDQK